MAENIALAEESSSKEVSPFDFAPAVYYTLNKNLEIIGESMEIPKKWGKAKHIFPRHVRKKEKVNEEVYVTLLSLYLGRFAEEGLSFINRTYYSTDEKGGIDLLALDPLFRVHLFELKNDKCKGSDWEQLEQYFNGTSFENLEKYIQDHLENPLFSEQLMKKLFYGLYAGTTSARTEKKSIEKKTGNKIKTKVWRSQDQKTELVVDYINRNIQNIWNKSISPEEILTNSKEWYLRLENIRKQIKADIDAGLRYNWEKNKQKSVLWLVGTGFDDEAKSLLRKFRGYGTDVRILKMEVRISKGLNSIFVKIQKEDFPERNIVNRNIYNWVEIHKENYTFNIHYYKDRSPAGKKLPDLGDRLRIPKVKIYDKNSQTVDLSIK